MAHLHEVRDFDTHYKIDPITMEITNANEAKNKLRLGDHNSEIYTFEIPRVIEGHDMSLCNMVKVHFINISADRANKSVDVHTVKDLAPAEDAEDTLVFTWEVSGAATMYAGSLNYRIEFACTDENGKYTYRKWTEVYKGISISDGFDNSAAVEKEYSDILSDWEARLDALEQGGASDEQITQAVNNYLKENPVQSGATTEQAAQINKNKEDIEKLATNKVDNDQLLNAVNNALEQAKASGEFKGDPGEKGDPGDDYVLTPADKQEIAEMVEVPEGGTVTDEQIAEALENYLKENPVEAGAGSSIFYSSLSFEHDEGSMLHFFKCYKDAIRNNGREVQVGDLIIFGNLSLGIVEEVTDTQVGGSLYASLKGEPGSGGGGAVSTVEPAEDDMPKVFLTGSEFGNMNTTKNEVKMGLEYISKTDKFKAAIKIKFQGNTSLTFPKKNFTIKMYTDDTYEDKLKKSFKDWNHSGNKYVLKANWIDHSHARNIISARLWGEVVESRPDYSTLPEELRNSPRNGAIDGFPVKLYVNGKYEGVYTWNVGKDDWMWGMDEDNANHVLMCAETNNDGATTNTPCNFRALWSGTDENYWTVEVGTNSTAVKTSLNNLIQFVMDNDGDDFRNGINNYLDIQSAIDYYIFQYEICGLDGLAKNMLLATYDGTRWICGAYDMDATFGLYWNGSRFVSAQYRCPEDYQETYSLLWERIEANFLPELRARQAELRKTVLSYSNTVTHFERFMDVIGLDLYAEDLTIYTGIPSGSTNNIKQIRNYIRDRQAYVDAEFAAMSGPVHCTGISLNKSTLTFTAEGTQTLIATVTPDGCTDAVTWESNNTSVATVVGGVVTAVANGSAVITAKCGEYSASCSVSVSGIVEPIPCTGISLDKTNLTLNGESTQTITATVVPSDTTDTLVWVSSNPNVASITVDGNVCTVHGVYDGNARITVTCGEFSANCDVSVSGFAVDILCGVSWHYNTFNGNTGAEITITTEISTDAIDVSKYAGKNICYKTDSSGGKIGFWDANGSFISGVYADSSVFGGAVPANAATMRLACGKNTKTFSVFFFGMDENLLDVASATFGKTYDSATGLLGDQNSWYSQKVTLAQVGNLVINNVNSGAFFDANDSYISGISYDAMGKLKAFEITEDVASVGLNYHVTSVGKAWAVLLESVKDRNTSIIEIT